MTALRWLPIPGWGDGYEIAEDCSQVRSVDRTIIDALGRRRRLRGTVLHSRGRGATLAHRGRRRWYSADELIDRARGRDEK